MKDLYRRPEAELLKFVSAENLAAGESTWIEEDNDGNGGDGVG